MIGTLEVIYDIENRRPARLIRVRGYRVPFDATGRMDKERMNREYPWMALLDEGPSPVMRGAKVRSIASRIAATRIRREIFFDPSPDQMQAVAAALGMIEKPPPGGPPLRVIKGKRAGD